MQRAHKRCERCFIDFDDLFQGEFHHIVPKIYGGNNSEENCSLLCHHCHKAAPNIKRQEDMIIYHHYFLRFASFKEAAQYFGVTTRFDLYTKLAFEIAKQSKT
jgi:hypothetical protein